MKVYRITLECQGVGYPPMERMLHRELRIHLRRRTFEWMGAEFPFYGIKRVMGNLFALRSQFYLYDFCFRPSWYQIVKFYLYYIYISATAHSYGRKGRNNVS